MRILEGEKHCLNERSMRYIQYCVEIDWLEIVTSEPQWGDLEVYIQTKNKN
jgi:hypothetical protein